MSGLAQWLDDVGTAALVGTARRDPPPAPAALGVLGDDTVGPEHRLLASAAVADAVTRAGARPAPTDATIDPAADEVRGPAGEQASQLLHLLLTQPPVSRAARDDLVVEWLRLAEAAGRRVPWGLLPLLLDFAAERRPVARALGGTLGERGTWLLGLNAAWTGLAAEDEGTAAGSGDDISPDWATTWATLPTAEATAVFAAGRRRDPAAARDLLDAEWGTLSARVRSEAVRSLRAGLSLADEPLLERALEDRAKTVREEASRVLDELPGSGRSRRMAERLRPLVRVKGTLVRHLEVDVPDAPDESGIRDGLTAPGTGSGSSPTGWLARIIRAAPLRGWTDISGRSAEATLKMIRDKDVLAAITEAVVDQRDTEWAIACVGQGVLDSRLLHLLPAAHRTDLLIRRVRESPAGHDLHRLLTAAPRPWPDELGRAVLRGVLATGGDNALAHLAAPLLPTALGPSLAPEVETALARVPTEATQLRRSLTETLQLHAFRTSLMEAFR